MNHGPEFCKWLELRAKTDRQLAAILSRTLANGMRLALEGMELDAPDLYVRARQAYAEARRLLPVLRDVGIAERRRLERELAGLGRLLDQTAIAGTHAGAACS